MTLFLRQSILPGPRADVIQQQLDEGAVLFLASEEIYFGLNSVGSEIWSLLPPANRTFGELCDALVSRYPEVAADVIEKDAADLLADLLRQGLVELDQGSADRGDDTEKAAS